MKKYNFKSFLEKGDSHFNIFLINFVTGVSIFYFLLLIIELYIDRNLIHKRERKDGRN